ncbi:MAG TPA: diguanylate cyclase DgcA [Spirochaetia bacterium]|nr:diguanylate cyclase DgcA [Spirochaetales bacterium]HRS64666.1 diguanylate cyclase DgcA [Spirochaetia bacterium]HPD79632.1 diguanylate cyclase DgcA [Spirochaetales bacterium]HQG39626.1 diguanylate cyclase DgcA [Spirochaetales bacterium]HQK33802.1 diguanylate cyclase DgcA [Spirochaetales bacterium]
MAEQQKENYQEELEKQIFDLKQLLEISKSLNSTLDYHILIDSILYTIMGQMKVLKAALYAKKGIDSTCFSLHRNYKGFELVQGLDYSLPEDIPAIKLFSKDYHCYTLQEVKNILGNYGGLDVLVTLNPSLLVPLKTKGVINGLIILGDQILGTEFTAYEKEYIINIATLAAIAINNAFLFEMTTTDMMTKLRLKHYFYTVLMEKMEQSVLNNQPLCVIMTDIDNFKHFNDTYGHNCGDLVLKEVAQIIQQLIRPTDIAARYGGEEFCIMLPNTTPKQAKLIAERIRSKVESTVTEYENFKLSVTISLGVACYDQNLDISAKYLIDRADKALYRSKQEGKNRVSVWE